MTGQKAALKQYQEFPQDEKFEPLDSCSTFFVRSKESTVNPPVILWLHGSAVDCIVNGLPVDEILSKGFALVMVDRFHSQSIREIKSTDYIEGPGFFKIAEKYYKNVKISNITQQEIDETTKETTWDVQDSLSLVK